MACMIEINFIFEVYRPSETLVGILDLNIGISVILYFRNLLIIYIFMPIYCLIKDIELINGCKIINKL